LLPALLVTVFVSTAPVRADSLDDEAPTLTPPTVTESQACATSVEEVPLMEEQGSAGIMFNLAEHPKSIRAVAAKLLRAALDSSAAKTRPVCATGCSPAQNPEIVYRVAPKAFLPKPQQQAMCVALERDTQSKPLNFTPQEFKTVDDMNAWVMEFSQGRGPEGEKLYAQCGGNCSPRYTFYIAPAASGLRVQTHVICGLARDRSVEDYDVSTALRKRCDAQPLASKP
jgi:hypothetical protein